MRIEPWIETLAEQLGCPCHPSASVAEQIQEAVDARRKRGPGRETHLTPYRDAWRYQYQGDPTCYGQLARYVAVVEKAADSPQKALRSFVGYIRKTPIEYVNLSKWAASWGSWLPTIPL